MRMPWAVAGVASSGVIRGAAWAGRRYTRGSWGGHAQGVGVVGHVDGDVAGLDFAAIVPGF
jgi:hypothetical protein